MRLSLPITVDCGPRRLHRPGGVGLHVKQGLPVRDGETLQASAVTAQRKSARSLRMAPFGFAPMMLFTGLPPWNTVMVGIDMTW